MIKSFYEISLHRRLLEEKIRHFAKDVRGLVLDVGSKNRRYDAYFKQAKDIVAIDTNPLLSDILKADTQLLPFKDMSFDTVISFEVFEYIQDYRLAFREINRVLKKNGLFIFSIPFLNPVHGDRIRYTEKGLKELLTDNFLIRECHNIGGRNCLIWDIFFEKIRNKYGNLAKLILFPLLFSLKKLALFFDKKEKNDRFAMGYFVICEKK